ERGGQGARDLLPDRTHARRERPVAELERRRRVSRHSRSLPPEPVMAARQPPEWAPHDFVWIGFPSHGELWDSDLAPAREEVAAFARAVYAGGKGEKVRLVAADAESAASARALAPFATVVEEAFGDIWLRD